MKTKILVIEDEADLRDGISELLTYEGFQVMKAENGNEGLTMALNENPNVILCDILMPGMNGYEVLEKWKNSSEHFTEVPFILVTALSNRSDYREGMEKGADDFLVKPFTRQELIGSINSRLGIQESRKAFIKQSIKKIEKYLKNELKTDSQEIHNNSSELQDILRKNKELEALLEKKENELIQETMKAIEITNNISEIKATIKKELHNSNGEKERKLLLKLHRKIGSKSLLSDNWAIFQMKFNQTYPHFISNITTKFSKLTQYDLIFISAMIVGLNTCQLADLLNISADSVRKSRYRLKKKLGLGKEDDLIKFIHSFNSK